MRFLIRWWCAVALLWWSPPLAAQVDPRGPVRTLRTMHFAIHFPVALDSLARVAAGHAERAYAGLARTLAPPAGPIELLLTDNVDVSNGYAQVFPMNRVVIYAVPPIASRELRFHDDWLGLVITHELAHIFHIDRAKGVWALGRRIFGRAPILFPNAALPSWVKEGVAVHFESTLTGSGRLVGTEFPQLARAAVRDSVVPAISRWSLATTRFPRGQTAYAWGALTMHRAAMSGDSLADSTTGTRMARYVDATAGAIIPYRLNRAARTAFGRPFDAVAREVAREVVGSLAVRGASGSDRADESRWRPITHDGWYLAAPRWISTDALVWSASNGRDLPGVYFGRTAAGADAPVRIAWRNSLDVNVPLGDARRTLGDTASLHAVAQRFPLLIAQVERRDPYRLRTDLFRAAGETVVRLTTDARMQQPDARGDGTIVAVQLAAGASRLVRVRPNGDGIEALTATASGDRWADPRWSPAGDRLAAIQLLTTGESRVVVLDTAGRLQVIVAGARGVFGSPSFTPDGGRLVWSSDRSGRMQLETAPVTIGAGVGDTTTWRIPRPEVRQASWVSTGVYEPSISPDGRQVAALLFGSDGYRLAVAPLDTTGPMAESRWYPAAASIADRGPSFVVPPPSRYAPVRQLLPRYWLPLLGSGRDGHLTLGLYSSASDILERHAWSAQLVREPTRGEMDGALSYRYAGFGVPVVQGAWSQSWDATLRAVNDSGVTLGFVARRRQFTTLSSTWVVPRVRWNWQGSVGAQYEARDYRSATDSALGPANSLLRRGTGYPSLFVTSSYSSGRLALRGISVEEGVSIVSTTSYRWREDQPSLGSWRTVLSGRAYRALPFPGFAKHVVAARLAAGVADNRTATEFAVGGASGVQSELLPGISVGDPVRTFPVRGIEPGVQRGSRAVGGTIEYRAPLLMLRRAPSPFGVYLDRMSVAAFTDAARAWCPSTLARSNRVICERPGTRDGWIASAGAEVVVDLALQYDVPYRLRIGAAAPYARPRELAAAGRFYVTLGGYF